MNSENLNIEVIAHSNNLAGDAEQSVGNIKNLIWDN
jgi:hypothetical protein